MSRWKPTKTKADICTNFGARANQFGLFYYYRNYNEYQPFISAFSLF